MAIKKPVQSPVAFKAFAPIKAAVVPEAPASLAPAPPAPAPVAPAPLVLVAEVAHVAVSESIQTPAEIVSAAPVAPDVVVEAPQTIVPAQATVITPPVAKTLTTANAAMEKTMKTAEEFVSFGQGNVEAIMKCGQIWAAGVQDLSKSFAATAQAQLDQTVSTWKALAGVKSLKEAMELQTSVARSSMEVAVAETGKLTDASMKLAEQTIAPISARVTLAVEKFGRAA